ncbi:amino acid ABC transporter permease [Lucifera butyrica]|nr:amino acid ABC transporter permease [Lucifera butyrica]
MSLDKEWLIILHSLPVLAEGALVTLVLSFAAMAGALFLGLAITIVRVFKIRSLDRTVRLYVSFFRGTPLLVQLLILYFGLTTFHIILTPSTAALLGLSLHFSAYISEIFRATVLSINRGQWEAAFSLGMTKVQTLRHIILPQAMRISIPPLWNSFIDVLKSSSLASVITVPELTRQIEEQSAAHFIFMPYFITLALFYWVMVVGMSQIQSWLEEKMHIPGM